MTQAEREILDKLRRHLIAQIHLLEPLLAQAGLPPIMAAPPGAQAAEAQRRREQERAGPRETKVAAG